MQHEPGTVSPFIQLTTCIQASSVSGEYTSGVVLSTSNTLVTHLNQQENCTTEGMVTIKSHTQLVYAVLNDLRFGYDDRIFCQWNSFTSES